MPAETVHAQGQIPVVEIRWLATPFWRRNKKIKMENDCGHDRNEKGKHCRQITPLNFYLLTLPVFRV